MDLHIDDYFYPYPVAGLPIPDDASFAKYNNGMTDRAEWRRHVFGVFEYFHYFFVVHIISFLPIQFPADFN